jgi:hypothetical protein
MNIQDPVFLDFNPHSEILHVQQRIDDFFAVNNKSDSDKILSQQDQELEAMVISESKGKYSSKGKHSQPASHKDRNKQPLSKAVAILEHRKKKGRNSNGQIEYKVQRESKEPQWEVEAGLKEDAPHLLE